MSLGNETHFSPSIYYICKSKILTQIPTKIDNLISTVFSLIIIHMCVDFINMLILKLDPAFFTLPICDQPPSRL